MRAEFQFSDFTTQPAGEDAYAGLNIGAFLQCAFPDGGNAPLICEKGSLHVMVPCDVRPEFLHPEIGSGGGCCGVSAVFVVMPKTSVNENDGLVARQYEIRLARQLLHVESVSKAAGVKSMTQGNFRSSVLAPDA